MHRCSGFIVAVCLVSACILGVFVSGAAVAAPSDEAPADFCERVPDAAGPSGGEAGFPGVATFVGAGIGAPAPDCGPSPCHDGRDNDGDSLVDYGPGQPGKDPGCDSASDREDPFNAPPPPPPPPPPSPPPPPDPWPPAPPPAQPMDLPLAAGQFELVTASEGYAVGLGGRWKTQRWIMRFDQLGISALNVVTMEGTFRVCYRPVGRGICGFSDVHGDATSTRLPWTWKGTDAGYPYGVRTSVHTVEFHYRGTAAICIFSRGCGPERHPWVRITFRDDNTMEVDAGVV